MFGLPLVRPRLYFIGAEVYDHINECRVGNDEASLDTGLTPALVCVVTGMVSALGLGPICQDMIVHVLTTLLQDPFCYPKATVASFLDWVAEVEHNFPQQDFAVSSLQ